jgi:hypothetical protein
MFPVGVQLLVSRSYNSAVNGRTVTPAINTVSFDNTDSVWNNRRYRHAPNPNSLGLSLSLAHA